VFVLGLVVVLLGTVVTGAGPNSGDGGAERNGLSTELTARVHSISMWLMLATLVALLVVARRLPGVRRAGLAVAAVVALQAVVGYTQYFLGNPPALVAVHMAGTALFTAAVTHLLLVARPTAAAPVPGDHPSVAASR
jgi:cytochrome c oxidase assembly protein subunit 15